MGGRDLFLQGRPLSPSLTMAVTPGGVGQTPCRGAKDRTGQGKFHTRLVKTLSYASPHLLVAMCCWLFLHGDCVAGRTWVCK